MEKDKKQMLHNMYNATSTDDGTGNDELESYENWLERQLLSRIEKIEQLDLHNVSNRRELLIAYELKMRSCTDEQAETMVDSYLATKAIYSC